MPRHKLHHCAVFRKRERVFVGAALDVVWLPSPAPVAIGVVLERVTVFVHPSVAIVIDSFHAQQFVVAFFVGPYLDHVPRIFRIDLVPAVGIFPAHHRNVAIAVEVVVRVFVYQSVAVIVYRFHARAWRACIVRLVYVAVASIGIDGGNDVKNFISQQFLYEFRIGEGFGEVPGRVKGKFRSLYFVGMDVAVDVHAGFAVRIAAFFEIGDGKAPEIAPFVRFSDRFEFGKIWVRGGDLLADLSEPGMIIIAVPGYGYFGIHRRACRLEQLVCILRNRCGAQAQGGNCGQYMSFHNCCFVD